MEARFARFIKLEEKRALALRKADWKRKRALRRMYRHQQKWSVDDMDYDHPPYEDPFEEDEIYDEVQVQDKEDEIAYVGLLVMFVVFLTAVFVVVAGVYGHHGKTDV